MGALQAPFVTGLGGLPCFWLFPKPMPTLDRSNLPATALADDVTRTPCFFSQVCRRRTAVEKAGRSVCTECAKRLRGFEYPSRDPTANAVVVSEIDRACAFDPEEELARCAETHLRRSNQQAPKQSPHVVPESPDSPDQRNHDSRKQSKYD
jgi:hypothetical protein